MRMEFALYLRQIEIRNCLLGEMVVYGSAVKMRVPVFLTVKIILN